MWPILFHLPVLSWPTSSWLCNFPWVPSSITMVKNLWKFWTIWKPQMVSQYHRTKSKAVTFLSAFWFSWVFCSRHLYVALHVAEQLRVYKINDPKNLTEIMQISIPSGLDNVNCDEQGSVWIGAQQILHKVILHLHDPINYLAPSQVRVTNKICWVLILKVFLYRFWKYHLILSIKITRLKKFMPMMANCYEHQLQLQCTKIFFS